MRQDRKTRIQYLLLIVLIVGAAYYLLFYSPYQGKKEELEILLLEKQTEWGTIAARIAQEASIDEEILSNNEKIEKLSKKMFVNIEQEEALKLTNMLNKKGKLVFDTVTLTEEFDTDLGMKILDEKISFTAHYEDVMEYLNYIAGYNKNIAVMAADMNVRRIDEVVGVLDATPGLLTEIKNDENSDGVEGTETEAQDKEEEAEEPAAEGGSESSEETIEKEYEEAVNEDGEVVVLEASVAKVEVELQLRYRALPSLQELGVERTALLNDIVNNRDEKKGPFHMYPEYVIAKAAREKEREKTEEESKEEAKEYKPRASVLGFENGHFFFVASAPDISGTALRSVIRIGGSYSADLNFDFLAARDYNSVSLVLEDDVFIQQQPESLVMQVYAFEVSDHKIGVVLVDSAGREYKIPFATSVSWTEWKELKTSLPDSVSYPAKVQRIYVEGVGYDQKTRGRYLFDMMEVEYPLPEKEQDKE